MRFSTRRCAGPRRCWCRRALDVRRLSAAGESLPPLLQGLVRTPSRASRAAASGLKQRLAGLSAAERERLLLELVRSTAATVLSASVESVEPERPLQELGLDSLMAVELRNRLAAATGLRLPATLLFDYPTPRALARRLQGDLVGQLPQLVVASPSIVPSAQGEPIAIVAMSCRYPGGADTPEALWELLHGGGDAISEFPADRGWDVEALYDPDPDAQGKSYVRRGGFLHRGAGVRRGVLRHQPARGAGDRSAAAAAAGDVVGGAGACGDCAGVAAGQLDRRVRGGHVQRLWRACLARACGA